MTLPPPWPTHPADGLVMQANVRQLDAEMAQHRGHRETFTLDLPLQWHTRMHAGCTHVPVPQYVGHYRGEPMPHIEHYPVVVYDQGSVVFAGSAPGDVAGHLTDFQTSLEADLTVLDSKIPSADKAKPRLELVLDVMARHYASWIKIHALVDGNGRTSRSLVNWIAVRYWQPLILPGRPPADRPKLIRATSPAVLNGNHRPLVNELRRRLVAARKAAAAAQQRATPPTGTPPPAST